MVRLTRTITGALWVVALTLCLGTGSCSDCPAGSTCNGNGGNGGPTDVEKVCAKIFECGGWGWEDQEQCEDEFLEDPGCNDAGGYLSCTQFCVDGDCFWFGSCEGNCWASHCNLP